MVSISLYDVVVTSYALFAPQILVKLIIYGDNGSEWVRNIWNENNGWVHIFVVEKLWFIHLVPPNISSSPVLLQSSQSTRCILALILCPD